MALSIANLATASDTDDSVTTGSFSVTTGSLLQISAAVALNGGNTPTDSWSISLTHSGAGTPTRIEGTVYGLRRAITAYYVTGATGSGTVTATYTGNEPTQANDILLVVNEITGQDATTPVESGAAAASTNNVTVDTGGTADSGDWVLSCFGYESSTGGTIPSGTTEVPTTQSGSDIRQFFNCYDDGATPDVSPTFGGTGGNGSGGVAWIVNVAAGGSGPDTPQGLHGISRGFNPQRSTRLGGELECRHGRHHYRRTPSGLIVAETKLARVAQ